MQRKGLKTSTCLTLIEVRRHAKVCEFQADLFRHKGSNSFFLALATLARQPKLPNNVQIVGLAYEQLEFLLQCQYDHGKRLCTGVL